MRELHTKLHKLSKMNRKKNQSKKRKEHKRAVEQLWVRVIRSERGEKGGKKNWGSGIKAFLNSLKIMNPKIPSKTQAQETWTTLSKVMW